MATWIDPIVDEPFSALALVLSGGLYALGLRALWRRAGRGQGVRAWQASAFGVGLLTLAVALLSPLSEWAEQLLSAHMTQHELLMLVAAPLLVMGRPLFVWLWAFPARGRSAIATVVSARPVTVAWTAISAPLAVFLIHAAALWIWHAPALYQLALEDERVHVLQHVSFLLSAALFWWGMVEGRYGRIGYGVAVLYVFLTAIHTGVLGALMTVSRQLWYPDYAVRAMAVHRDALADQQLAGLVMWIPASLVFICLGLGLLAAWLGESGRRVAVGRLETMRQTSGRP